MRVGRLTAFVLLICLSSSPPWAQTAPTPVTDALDVEASGDIAFTGHHALFDRSGNPLSPSIVELETWLAEAHENGVAALADGYGAELQELTFALDELDLEPPVKQSLLIGWMADQDPAQSASTLTELNQVVREHWYLKKLSFKDFTETFDSSTALPAELSEKAKELGVLGTVKQSLTVIPETPEEYREFCREKGVPVPPDWDKRSGNSRGEWRYEGDLGINVLRNGRKTEIWSYRSDGTRQPKGTCIALPRFYDLDPDVIRANGVICLGLDKNGGNACFFDKAWLNANQRYGIETFQAGPNLQGGGECSDCHAGENPFIVHPTERLNLGSDIRSPRWHTPLVKSAWPQNPGPMNLLDIIDLPPGQKSCLDCHKPAQAGRFPDVFELNRHVAPDPNGGNPKGLSGYCLAVVEGALRGRNWQGVGRQGPTMGLVGANNPDPKFDVHRNALLALCQQEPEKPGTVPIPDDNPDIVSPPLLGPLYACATVIEIRGAIFGADVALTINGNPAGNRLADSSESLQFQVPALSAGDKVIAIQTVNGKSSPPAEFEVISHRVDYPGGLPVPEIDPDLVHKCGQVIAVRHVKGAIVTVTVNDGTPGRFTSGGDWTNTRPGKSPFDLGDKFRAYQQLCEDKSGLSPRVTAVAEPNPMPQPRLDPATPLAGQPYLGLYDLANGAGTKVEENSAGVVSEFATAVNRNPEVNVANRLGRPIQAGDRFRIESQLCKTVQLTPPPTETCETLPVPRIAQPFVGEAQVKVIEYVPGARILVFGNAGEKIGDGSGSVVGLIRPIRQNEVLTVMQRLDKCISTNAYRIAAACISEEACDLK